MKRITTNEQLESHLDVLFDYLVISTNNGGMNDYSAEQDLKEAVTALKEVLKEKREKRTGGSHE